MAAQIQQTTNLNSSQRSHYHPTDISAVINDHRGAGQLVDQYESNWQSRPTRNIINPSQNPSQNLGQREQSTAHYPKSLQRLIRTLNTISSLTPTQLKHVIEEVGVRMQDLTPWADFTHSPRDSYGRKMVYHGGHFEIMVMSWLPGDFSAIHDHGHTQWGAVQCFGDAKHYVYTLENKILKNPVAAHYQYGDIHTVDHDTIHQMGNNSSQSFLSMHVYGCQQAEDSITAHARVFDLLEESIQFTSGGVFFCLPEHQIEQRQYGITGDAETVSMQSALMLDRMQRMLDFEADVQIKQKLALLKHRMNR